MYPNHIFFLISRFLLLQSKDALTVTEGDFTSLPGKMNGQASHLGLLHFFMPWISRLFLLGGEGGT